MLQRVTSLASRLRPWALEAAVSRCQSSGSNTIPKVEKSINQVTLLGRVGGEPQKRGSEKHPVVIFSLATNSRYESGGEAMTATEWHRVSVFQPSLRDMVYTYMRKGQRVFVSGKLNYGEVRDEAGNPRQVTSIVAEEVIFFQSGDSSIIP